MRANYHTHTFRCRHAVGTEREYIETAIARGLTTLGFADHCPQIFPCDDYYSNFRMYPQELEGYFKTLSSLRDEYKKEIDIKIGLETEYYPEIFPKFLEFISAYDFDYLILGQHYIDNEYDTKIYSGFVHSEEEYLKRYVDQILEAISTEKFSYIAHPDLFPFDGDDEIWKKHYLRLCEGAKSKKIPLEINFLGLASGRLYPSDKFFALAKSVGNDFVLGCDAHEPDAILNPTTYAKINDFCAKHGITPLEDIELKKPLA